jgi:hypothetical protein
LQRRCHIRTLRAATEAFVRISVRYKAQLGNLPKAKTSLKRATVIDAKFRLMALEDPDLEPL